MALRKKQGIWETARVFYLPVEQIVPNPAQPRKRFSPQGLSELAESIKEHGILQPLTVRRTSTGYELISGERRLRAARQTGLREVPCLIAGVDEEESSLLALVENLQRRDLNFIEEAAAIARLIRLYGFSQDEAARKLGKSQSAVANKLRLLRLPPKVIGGLQANGLTERHARSLLRLEDEDQQLEALRQIVENGWNVAQTEAYIDDIVAEPKEKPPRAKKRNTFIIKDVRFFLNSITRGMRMMKSAGVDAQYGKTETEEDIVLTIRIPKK
jgi:ParB family chromosome partitioning protein